MGSVLPTVIIVLAEVIVILLIALGVMLYLHLRKSKRHQHEMDALMGIARHAEKTPAPQDAHPAEPTPMPTAHPDPPTGEGDTEFASRTNQSITEIREDGGAHGKFAAAYRRQTRLWLTPGNSGRSRSWMRR